MPAQTKAAAMQFRSKPALSEAEVASLPAQDKKRFRAARARSEYWGLFGRTRPVGQPRSAGTGVILRARGNPSDKVIAERRALAVLKKLHEAELQDLYERELDYVELGGA